MNPLRKINRAGMALALALAALGTAHATSPGENGVVVYEDTQGALWRAPTDGSAAPSLLADRGFSPAVSPDGRKVAYAVPQSGINIWVSNIDGSNPVRVVAGAYSALMKLAWSPDGKTLAYSEIDGPSRTSMIRLVSLSTGDIRTLALVGDTTELINRLSWSPGGDQILVSVSWGNGSLIDAATGQVRPFVSGHLGGYAFLGDWSEAVIGVQPGTSADRCVASVNLDGSPRWQSGTCQAFAPMVSPDRKSILATVGTSSQPSRQLAVSDFNGTVLRVISNDARDGADWGRLPKAAMRSTFANGLWSTPVPLGGDANTYISQSAIAVMPDQGAQGGALRRAVAIGPDGRVVERAQAVNGTWGAWFVVPGVNGKLADGVEARQVAIAGALDGSSQVVIVGSDGLVYHAMRYASGLWSGFNPVDGANGAPNFAARDVAIAIVNSSPTAPGQAHVAANGLGGGAVYHRVRLDDGNWTPWGALGSPATDALALAFAGNKDLYLVATRTSGGIAQTVRHPNGAWDGWVNVSRLPANALKDVSLSIASSVSTGTAVLAHLTYVRSDGAVWYQTRYAPAFSSSWTNDPYFTSWVMSNGRSVSTALGSGNALELLAVQAENP